MALRLMFSLQKLRHGPLFLSDILINPLRPCRVALV